MAVTQIGNYESNFCGYELPNNEVIRPRLLSGKLLLIHVIFIQTDKDKNTVYVGYAIIWAPLAARKA